MKPNQSGSSFGISKVYFQRELNSAIEKALKEDNNFLEGLNVCKGNVTYKAVADVFGHSFVSPSEAIK